MGRRQQRQKQVRRTRRKHLRPRHPLRPSSLRARVCSPRYYSRVVAQRPVRRTAQAPGTFPSPIRIRVAICRDDRSFRPLLLRMDRPVASRRLPERARREFRVACAERKLPPLYHLEKLLGSVHVLCVLVRQDRKWGRSRTDESAAHRQALTGDELRRRWTRVKQPTRRARARRDDGGDGRGETRRDVRAYRACPVRLSVPRRQTRSSHPRAGQHVRDPD